MNLKERREIIHRKELDTLKGQLLESQNAAAALARENERYVKYLQQIENAGNMIHTNQVPYPLRVTVEGLKAMARGYYLISSTEMNK